MEIRPMTGPAGPPVGQSSGGDIGKQAFLQLLLTQLQNQDPLKPMEDREFIAQLAQFNTLEQMQEVQKTLADVLISQQMAQATGLIGKTVSGLLPTGEAFTAQVDQVRFGPTGPLLVTTAGVVALTDVSGVA